MAFIPREPRPGERPDSATIIQLIRYVRDLARKLETLLPRPGTGRAGTAVHPFALSGVIEDGTAKIRVAIGKVNSRIPKIGTTFLDDPAGAPALTVTGTYGQIYLRATVDSGGNLTDLVILGAASMPADTSTLKHELIGTWASAGGVFTAVNSILRDNRTLYLCAGKAIWES